MSYKGVRRRTDKNMERETRLELATLGLEGRCSTN